LQGGNTEEEELTARPFVSDVYREPEDDRREWIQDISGQPRTQNSTFQEDGPWKRACDLEPLWANRATPGTRNFDAGTPWKKDGQSGWVPGQPRTQNSTFTADGPRKRAGNLDWSWETTQPLGTRNFDAETPLSRNSDDRWIQPGPTEQARAQISSLRWRPGVISSRDPAATEAPPTSVGRVGGPRKPSSRFPGGQLCQSSSSSSSVGPSPPGARRLLFFDAEWHVVDRKEE